jgi:endoglucanase
LLVLINYQLFFKLYKFEKLTIKVMKKLSTLLSFCVVISLTTAYGVTFTPQVLAQNAEEAQVDEETFKSLQGIEVSYKILESYTDGYQLEISVVGLEEIENWVGSITLPENQKIIKNYGILISKGDNVVNFSGDAWNSDLSEGEIVKAVVLVEGNPEEAKVEFGDYLEDATLGEPIYSSFTEQERNEYMQTLTTDGTEQVTSPPPTTPTDETEQVTSPTTSTDGTEQVTPPTTPTDGTEQVTSPPPTIATGEFNYAEALQKNWLLYMANRSGPMGIDNIIEWRSDSTLNDGKDVGKDLSGGYFDAGDHIKFTQPMAYSINLLAWSGVDYRESYQQAGQLDELLAAVKWGTDYFLKCHESNGSSTARFWVQVGDKSDHDFWVPPEEIEQRTARPSFSVDPQRPGTDVAAGTASALAASSLLFAGTDDAYSAKLLNHAVQLFEFAETYKGKYSDSVPQASPFYTSWSGFEDELVLAAIWLYRATGDAEYLTKAENYYRQGIGHIGSYTMATDDHSYAAMTLLAQESADPFFKEEFKSWAQNWLTGSGGINITDAGFAVRAEWASAPLALGTSFLLQWYNDFVEPNQQYSTFALQQLNYLLGKNPGGFSYVVGFGEKYPLRAHHRGSAGSVGLDGSDQPNDNLLVGALVGGPRNSDNSHQDRRNDWVTNEVGTSYNAPLAATLIQQYKNYGGDPLSDSELSQIPGIK